MSGIIVADAGPLHYLILIDCADLLPVLFSKVVIPTMVRDELVREGAPDKVKVWMSQPKSWLDIQLATEIRPIHGLHPGEIEALNLALQIRAASLLMDDLDARKAAKSLGLKVIGTVGLLEHAAEKGLLDLPQSIAKLRQTNFFISPVLLVAALERDRLRREGK